MTICIICNKKGLKLCISCVNQLDEESGGYIAVIDIFQTMSYVFNDLKKTIYGDWDIHIASPIFNITLYSDARTNNMADVSDEDINLLWEMMLSPNAYKTLPFENYPSININMYRTYVEAIEILDIYQLPDSLLPIMIHEIMATSVIHELTHFLVGECPIEDWHNEMFDIIYHHFRHLAGYNVKNIQADVYFSDEILYVLMSQDILPEYRFLVPDILYCELCLLFDTEQANPLKRNSVINNTIIEKYITEYP